MKSLLSAFCIVLLSTPCVFAQQPQGLPEVLALQGKLIKELSESIQCTTQFILLQQKEAQLSAELTKAKIRIKELEAKQEEKK